MGIEPNKLDYLVLSKGNFEILIRKLLLVRRYRVEIFVSEGSVKSCDWSLRYKGSPGYLSQLEEIVGDGLGSANEQSTCLMAVNVKSDAISKGRLVGIACVYQNDYTLSVSEFTDDVDFTQLESIVVQVAPSECVAAPADNDYKALKKVMDRASVTVTKVKKSEFTTEGLIQDLNRLLKFKEDQQKDANGFQETKLPVAMSALAAAVRYTSLLNDDTNFGRFRISSVKADYLQLDSSALSALNVFPELGDTNTSPTRSIYGLLDRCRTQHGKRLLCQLLRQPLRDINLINERLDIIQLLVSSSQMRLQLHEDHLRRMPDLQALARRLARKKAGLQDCYRIYQAINRIPVLLKCLSEFNDPTIHSVLCEPIAELNNDLEKFQQMIETTIDLEAVDRGDFLVKPSFDEELQVLANDLEKLQNSAEKELNKAARDLDMEAGKTIKLENNPQHGFVFRYYILGVEGFLKKDLKYTIVDAIKGGVRFRNSCLGDITENYLQAKAAYEKEQDKVVAEIINIASTYSECLYCLSNIISKLDVLVSLSVVASTSSSKYTRPVLTTSIQDLVLKDVRHPCLELQEGVSYIPNDVVLERDSSLMHIVTGANMGGKSTWMRSCGVAVILAHVGSFVPAEYAKIPILRSLCARIGASDREEKGQSTFMLEMLETAGILRNATADSLVLIDELGRGTSTYEGCGIAWAIAEKLSKEIQCFCLFATHYHELTRLASCGSRVVNSQALADVVDGRLVLLHRVVQGPAAKSLGLHVAKIADLPEDILQFAEEKQAELETDLCEVESEVRSEDTSEGQAFIKEFLIKCKQIQEKNESDEKMMAEIKKLKQEMLQTDNKYVAALLSR
nr:DNA mismatch repair protein Msh2 [Danaus plexippus plexippus]